MKGSYEFGKENGSKILLRRRTGQRFVPRLGMNGSKSLGRRTGQRFCSKIWDEGFKEFGKENGSKISFKDLG